MAATDEMVERIAQIIDPGAFDKAAFNAHADIYTKAGDFERGRDRAREKARAAIGALIREIAARLRRGGATLPAPLPEGTIESAMKAGLSIALVLVEGYSPNDGPADLTNSKGEN